MERFKKYLGKEVNLEKAKTDQLEAYQVVCTYLPDQPEDFDELEFRTGFGGENNIVLTVTLELGKIKRVMFSEADENDPDLIRSLSASRLREILSEKDKQLTGFFEHITK